MMKNLSDHVVICNWNHKSDELIQRLHTEFIHDRNVDWHTIVVVAKDVSCFPDDSSFGDVVLIPGDPANPKLLRRAGVDKACTVIILPDEKKVNPDDRTLMIALQLRRVILVEQARGEGRLPKFVRVVAKVVDSSNAPIFRNTEVTGIHDVVCESDLGLRVFAQTSISPGLTYILRDLLDYSDDSSELYLIPIPEDWVTGKYEIDSFHSIFNRALVYSRKRGNDEGVIPLGFCRKKASGDLNILINSSKGQVKAANLGTFQPGDQVLVMAYDRNSAISYFKTQADL